MQYKKSAKVITSDGQEVGRIDRVVIDPQSKAVSHIVVRKGFLFTEDKVVPVDLIASATEDSITLRTDAERMPELPLFEETHYVTFDAVDPDEPDHHVEQVEDEYASPYMWYPPVGPITGLDYALAPYGPYYAYAEESLGKAKTVRNIPENTIPLKEGARIVSADGEHVGNVERIFTDPADDRVTHLLISQGLLFTTQRLIPSAWIREVTEDEIKLGVASQTLERLPEYITR